MLRLPFVINPMLLATAAGAVAVAAGAAARTVWDAVYSEQQAGRGQTVYNSRCARCHGDALLGGENAPALVDRDFLEKWNGKSLASFVGRIRITMPSDGPGKLSRQQCTDIAAFLLSANNFPAGDGDLTTDADTLNEILFQAKK
jgi:mono/diheme cytochrome c family protein